VGLKAGLNDLEKRKFLPLPGLELRPFCRPTRSQSLYHLRYPGSFQACECRKYFEIKSNNFLTMPQWSAYSR
jgi:hypothetical protein